MAHRPSKELVAILEKAKKKVKIGANYRHYKTKGQYSVIDIALQEATEEPCVIYRSSYSPELLWVRDVQVWNEFVEGENGKKVRRFTRIADDT